MNTQKSTVADCEHAKQIKSKSFKKMIYAKFNIPDGEDPVVIQCETCTDSISSTSESKDVTLDTHIGFLWVCLHCGKVVCQSDAKGSYMHALTHHRSVGKECHLFINCYDSHIFCMSCRIYLYPREIAMTDKHEKRLTKVAEYWLQILGRARLWWRHDLSNEPGPGLRGLKNFGNTCFFVSTVQSFMHNSMLLDHLSCNTAVDEKNKDDGQSQIQKQLVLLSQEYWDEDGDGSTINPKPFWKAVQTEALFGEYYMKTMEDANTLLLDILTGIDFTVINELFNIPIISTLTCLPCYRKEELVAETIFQTFQTKEAKFSQQICQLVAGYTIGAKSQSKNSETLISLAIADQLSDMEEKSKTTREEKKKTVPEDKITSTSKEDDPLAAIIFDRMSIANANTWKNVTLEDSLSNYFAEEPVTDYLCGHCSLRGHAVKRLKMTHAPHLLILNLKRFSPAKMPTDTKKITVRIKCHREVTVPLILRFQTDEEGLSVYKGSDSSQPGLVTYQLFAKIVHDGGLGGGHYMAYARQRDASGLTNPAAWFWFSDKYFGSVSNEEVSASETYIAFYQRLN